LCISQVYENCNWLYWGHGEKTHGLSGSKSLSSSETIPYSTPTGSLWPRQSQRSFNTLTPFYFLCHSLHVSAPTGHLQVKYTIRYFKDYF
jgi:hypothetical protein